MSNAIEKEFTITIKMVASPLTEMNNKELAKEIKANWDEIRTDMKKAVHGTRYGAIEVVAS